jgi:hypothetical protein
MEDLGQRDGQKRLSYSDLRIRTWQRANSQPPLQLFGFERHAELVKHQAIERGYEQRAEDDNSPEG